MKRNIFLVFIGTCFFILIVGTFATAFTKSPVAKLQDQKTQLLEELQILRLDQKAASTAKKEAELKYIEISNKVQNYREEIKTIDGRILQEVDPPTPKELSFFVEGQLLE